MKNRIEHNGGSKTERLQESHAFELFNQCLQEAQNGNFSPQIERNEMSEILTPNGQVSRLPNELYVRLTRTPSFYAWFGDWVNNPEQASKVIYEDTKEPKIVWHGITDGMPDTHGFLGDKDHAPMMVFFTSEKDHASFWSHSLGHMNHSPYVGTLFAVFLNLKKPKIISHNPSVDEVIEIGIMYRKKREFDSIIQTQGDIGLGDEYYSDQYVAYGKEQIMHIPSPITS